MSGDLGYYLAPEKLQECSISLDLESVIRSSPHPLEESTLPPKPEGATEESQTDRGRGKKIKVYDRRVICLSGVVMRNAKTPDNVDVQIGSIPYAGIDKPLSEEDLLFTTAYTLFGMHGNKEELESIGVNLESVEEAYKKSGLPRCLKPVIIGAFTSGDMNTLFAGFARAGMESEFSTAPQKDRKGEVANEYVNSQAQSPKKVDLLDIARANGALQDIISLDELARQHKLPGKYLPEKDSSVDELWRQGRLEDIVEYNRVDALNTHYLNLYYLRFNRTLKPQQFKTLWERSTEQLGKQAEKNGDVGLKWFLDRVPQPHQMGVARLRKDPALSG